MVQYDLLPKDKCAGSLVTNVTMLRGAGPFKRWGLIDWLVALPP
jgi:hypothetical protein